ncbi:hypothetical protein AB2B41_11695 [Marimonas sp. MJW-29]|uniref:Uncharacterized protein n=1 Tax=Sulfitobacter sediminis TaxID=3234186 RepID=A0ABV3RPK3_9RHOB
MNEPVFLDVIGGMAWFILRCHDRGNAINQAIADMLLEGLKPEIGSAPVFGA